MHRWSRTARWLGLTVCRHHLVGTRHAQVGFCARFADADGQTREHCELSAFVLIGRRWYFLDPTVPLPARQQPCLCASGKKFKRCCAEVMALGM